MKFRFHVNLKHYNECSQLLFCPSVDWLAIFSAPLQLRSYKSAIKPHEYFKTAPTGRRVVVPRQRDDAEQSCFTTSIR